MANNLGLVVRFAPRSATGIRKLEAEGFRVASSRDFRGATAVPNDFGGADVQYFERFGIAIVRQDEERLATLAAKTDAVRSIRQERRYQAIAARKSPGVQFSEVSETWGIQAVQANLSKLSGAGIKVAVLDTGLNHQHPDFRGRNITKKLFASQSSEDDTDSHGTHCIGTACGPLKPTNAPRYGVAHQAHIFAGKVLGDDGWGTDRSIIAGMDWAISEGCQVISMSLGAEVNLGELPNKDYEQIGKVCLDAGTIVVAAAGNESSRPWRIAPVGSPANASTIMAVGAIDRNAKVATFSCGGLNPNQEVDIAAPGVDVLSSVLGTSHRRYSGTSMATPHVAGVAALLAQSNRKLRGRELWTALLKLAKPLTLSARDVGRGMLQVPVYAGR